MICQHCNTSIDDDLVFCTNCGQRLFQQPLIETPTVVQPPAAETFAPRPAETVVARKSSPVLWILIGVILIAIPVVLLGVYLLTVPTPLTVAINTQKSPPPAKSATPKANTNQAWIASPTPTPTAANTKKADKLVANTEPNNTGPNNTEPNKEERMTIVRERLELEPNSHYAVPFSSDGNRDIVGTVKVLRGDEIGGFVFSQAMFDEHFPDETYKLFSFGPEKNLDVQQRLVEEDYVLVFVNDSDKPCLIQTDFYLK